MDFDNWSNAEWLREKEAELKSVDSSLSIESVCGTCSERAISVGCTLQQKGNKKIIDNLLSKGWVMGIGSVRCGKRYVKMEIYSK